MPAPEQRIFAKRMDDSEPGPEIPAKFLHAVRSRRKAVVRARAGRLCGVGAAAVVGLVLWTNAPRSGPSGPEVAQTMPSSVVAAARTASDQSFSAMQREWAATGQLPLFSQPQPGRPSSETIRLGDARRLISTDG